MTRLRVMSNAIAWRWSRLWQWVFRQPRWQRVHLIRRVNDEPDKCAPGILYVIEDADRTWAATMACPCGCGHPLHMNLIPDSKPVWNLNVEADGSPTLTPSVWRREACDCHFLLRQGQIIWV
jgi:hypothetical protein